MPSQAKLFSLPHLLIPRALYQLTVSIAEKTTLSMIPYLQQYTEARGDRITSDTLLFFYIHSFYLPWSEVEHPFQSVEHSADFNSISNTRIGILCTISISFLDSVILMKTLLPSFPSHDYCKYCSSSEGQRALTSGNQFQTPCSSCLEPLNFFNTRGEKHIKMVASPCATRMCAPTTNSP